jgi:hypothetical protein
MDKYFRVWTASDIRADIILHHVGAIGGSGAVVIGAMIVGQRNATRAWNHL